MSESIEKEIISIVADVSGVDEKEISLQTNFVKDLEIDSIKTIEITVAIEKKFKVSVRDEEIPKLATVQDSVDLIKRLLPQGKGNA